MNFQAMPDKCATCAFREGTRANRSSLTLFKARLCAMIGEPFHCHDNAVYVTDAGKIIDAADRNRFDFIDKIPCGEYQPRDGEEWKNCAGWAELVEQMKAKDLQFKQDWQIKLAQGLLEVIEKAEYEREEWDEERVNQKISALFGTVQEQI